MGTGSVESLVLKWLRRLPTVPVPFFGPAGGNETQTCDQLNVLGQSTTSNVCVTSYRSGQGTNAGDGVERHARANKPTVPPQTRNLCSAWDSWYAQSCDVYIGCLVRAGAATSATHSRATESAGFAGSGCKSFDQMFSLTEARRQHNDGYRGEEIDKYTAMTFMAFLTNWNEKLNFYGGNWNGKHNDGVPLYMPRLMLDLPVMRASTVYNWREGPILTRGKDGTIRRNKVIYQTKGLPFGG